MSAVKLANKCNSVSVHIPMKLKNRAGRKEMAEAMGVCPLRQ